MRRCGRLLLGLIMFVTALGGTFAGNDVTLAGGFVWERPNEKIDGKLEAVFTPTGDNRWDVAFHFEWENGPHTWLGTAEGSLQSGEFSGKVVSDDDRQARFQFKGTFEGGTFSGTHAQVLENGSLRDTGTMRLGPTS